MNEASAPGLVVPDLTPMSTTPAVRRPYCAGSAPVSSESELANRGDRTWLNSDSPSGNCTPSSRYCRLPWSPRTWTWPKPSCTTPGARSSTWFSGAFSPCGVFWMAVRLKSYLVAPRLGRIELRSSSILVAVTVMPGSVDGGGWVAGSVCAEADAMPANRPLTDIKPHTRRIGRSPTAVGTEEML